VVEEQEQEKETEPQGLKQEPEPGQDAEEDVEGPQKKRRRQPTRKRTVK
jgi:hypothetical protein